MAVVVKPKPQTTSLRVIFTIPPQAPTYLRRHTFLSEPLELGEALIWDANVTFSFLKQEKQSCTSAANQCIRKSW